MLTKSLLSNDPLLTPAQLCELLREEFNIRRSPRRLQDLRMNGRGPPFVRDGLRVLYPRSGGREWARKQLGPLVTSTAEESRNRQVGAVLADTG